MDKRKKIGIGVGAVIVLGVLSVLALREEGGPATSVRAEAVSVRPLVATVTATGHLEAKRSVDISADVSGRIVELAVEEGDSVRRGDLILRIDQQRFLAASRRAEASLAEARAREAQARANFQQARRDYDRIRSLREAGENFVTESEVDRAQTDMEVQRALLDAARESVAQAEAALSEAEDQLAKTTIRAPMTGVVTRLNVEEGETAIVGTTNVPGSLLATVSDLSTMEAVVEVDETDVPRVEVGDSSVVEIDAFPGRRFSGRVTKIGNSSVLPRSQSGSGGGGQAVDFEVRITLDDPPAGIRSDLSATAEIVTARSEESLAIPIISLTLRTEDQLSRHAASPDTAARFREGDLDAGGGGWRGCS
jgi:HlyD family secretion protein